VDSGLACYLLGIREPEQLRLHPLRGPIFESWVASEVLKARVHRGHPVDLFHLREDRGQELDLVVEFGEGVYGVEAKSGATLTHDMLRGVKGFASRGSEPFAKTHTPRIVYGGDRQETREGVELIPWGSIQTVSW
jgi:predicted AAA+ superfamily ATPase